VGGVAWSGQVKTKSMLTPLVPGCYVYVGREQRTRVAEKIRVCSLGQLRLRKKVDDCCHSCSPKNMFR
jgi:hypothetical protein